MTDNNAPTKVVVIGGGHAGALAANHFRMRGDVDIMLLGEGIRLVVETQPASTPPTEPSS